MQLVASIDIRLGERESIAQQLDPRRRTVSDHDFDDIESEEDVWIIEQSKPGQAAARDPVLFCATDGIERPAEVFPRPRFYFNEHEGVAIAANDVNLTAAASTEIAVENFVALSAQKPPCEPFAASAELEMVRIRMRKPAAPPVRKIGDGLDKARAHAISSGAIRCHSLCAG